MATPAKVNKTDGKNNHDAVDEQAGEWKLSLFSSGKEAPSGQFHVSCAKCTVVDAEEVRV
jgi:hypothetical protein